MVGDQIGRRIHPPNSGGGLRVCCFRNDVKILNDDGGAKVVLDRDVAECGIQHLLERGQVVDDVVGWREGVSHCDIVGEDICFVR